MNTNQIGPLKGVKVLDVSTMIAAPFGATLLGDMGADIIKIEVPIKGDTLRNVGPWKGTEPLRWPGMSRNKRSVTLNLRESEGQKLFLELVKKSDVIIENFRPGTLDKWNLNYDTLKKANSKIIVVRVSGYGQTGPYRSKAGFGTPSTAFSGYTYIQGFKDRPPVTPSFSLTDYVTGIFVAFATSSALYYRDVNEIDEGQEVEMGLYESMFRMMEFLIAEYDQLNKVRERSPILAGHSSPAGTYKTKDGKYLVLVTSTDQTFERLAKAIGREDMLLDPKFYTNSVRLENDAEVQQIVESWIESRTSEEVMEILDEAGVPISPILSIQDIFENPQYQSRQNIVEVEHPKFGTVKVPGVVPKFSKTPGSIRFRAPKLGEHNHEVYVNELGITESKLQEFVSKGII
ncbi:formyl-CoA transferase [Pueribacillus theae]|uniref:Formyl-CoA transferase n=1 Tax=Pueribacillus theae TaxID=2171751 RepID=A0A2U1JHT9_9BACI|nr:CoA transferase [Pueribacillus theae]PWA04691.1 formyl-CoA transferase [Pueribacillus theae]